MISSRDLILLFINWTFEQDPETYFDYAELYIKIIDTYEGEQSEVIGRRLEEIETEISQLYSLNLTEIVAELEKVEQFKNLLGKVELTFKSLFEK